MDINIREIITDFCTFEWYCVAHGTLKVSLPQLPDFWDHGYESLSTLKLLEILKLF